MTTARTDLQAQATSILRPARSAECVGDEEFLGEADALEPVTEVVGGVLGGHSLRAVVARELGLKMSEVHQTSA